MNERQQISRLLELLHQQPILRFPQAGERIDAPTAQGVYVIRSKRGKVVHVGRTVRGQAGLRQRLRNHLSAQSSFVQSWLGGNGAALRDGFTYQYIEVPSDRLRALLENIATAWHCPVHLGVGARSERTSLNGSVAS
jgi:hypothetical protein